MPLILFDKINAELKSHTKELAYHVVGDPLVVNNLNEYLDISASHNLKVNITTTANNLNESMFDTLMHKTIKQINFSLNSYNANSHKKTLKEYLDPIFAFTKHAILHKQDFFINFRIWNLDDDNSAKEFNEEVFSYANEFFNSSLNFEDIYIQKPKNIRLERKIFFNFDEYFTWPALDAPYISKKGFCYGLDSHFGILSSGTVVPCCLDKDGIINLGNLEAQSLKDVLSSQKVLDIKNSFKQKNDLEDLCQRCEYRTRFDK